MTKTVGRQKILQMMTENPDRLFNEDDFLKASDGLTKGSLLNVLHNLRIEGKILRHKDKSKQGKYRYAVFIDAENVDVYVHKPNSKMGQGRKQKKKNKVPTAKDVSLLFGQLYVLIAEIETAALSALDQTELTNKEIARFRAFTDKL